MHQTPAAWIAAILCPLAASLCAQAPTIDVVEPSTKAPRGKQLEWKSAQGRPYFYRLPKAIEAKSPPDLVIMLHGSGMSHWWSFANYPVARDGGDFRKRDIVVSPDGCTPRGEAFEFIQGPKDGEQIAGLIAEFRKRFPIGRVYLYGHSQGAFFCYWFAGEHPELIDGFVAHAGNVLGNVRHPKLAKQRVAVAILHGRADAVVPVECATETEKVYRGEGYEKLKLEIVDGLNADTGHWPLPVQVAKLFDWLDQVSTQSAAQSMRIVASELQKKAPDLATIAVQVKKARALLPKADEADKKALPPQLDAVQGFLDKAAAAHIQWILPSSPAGTEPKVPPPTGPTHYVILDRAFGDHAEWKKRMASMRDLVKAHDKAIDKAKKAIDKDTKEARAAAVRGLEQGSLSGSWEELRTLLDHACTNAKPPDDDCKQKVEAHGKAQKELIDQAKKQIAEINQPLLDDLKAAMPALFAKDEGEDEGDK